MPETRLAMRKALPASFVSVKGNALRWPAYVFLIFLSIAFFIPGFTTLPPVDRDEASFAQASKQMVETDNYVDIRLQDKPRYKKPIGIYWLQAASVKLFSPDHLSEIWAYRLPSLTGAIVSVLMTALLGSLLFGPVTGFLGAVMLASCLVLNVEARLAKTDAALLATILIAQYALAKAYLGKLRRPILNAFVFWTAIGIGILIKGPIIILVTLSTVLWVHFTYKNSSWTKFLRPCVGIAYVLALTTPWFFAILSQSHGQFLQDSAGHDLLAKIWQGQDRGILPPGAHLMALLFVFFPFSLFAYLAMIDAWKSRHRPAMAFCVGWIVPVWIVFELSLTKLPHYVLPVYPAIALLAAKVFIDGYPRLLAMSSQWFLALIATLWLVAGAALGASLALLPYLLDHRWITAQIVVGGIIIVIQGLSLILLAQKNYRSIYILACGNLVFIACSFGLTLPNIQHLWMSQNIYELAESVKPCPNLPLISAGYNEPSLVFMTGTPTLLLTDGAAAADGLIQNTCSVVAVDKDLQPDFLNRMHQTGHEPQMFGKLRAYNIGHGHMAAVTLYGLKSQ